MSLKFKNKVSEWYTKEKNNMLLHEATQKSVEALLPTFDLVLEELNQRRIEWKKSR
jgi:hypothetical protein